MASCWWHRRPCATASHEGGDLGGGTGSRLFPLTRITNKHLLPIGDRPMISYGVEALVKAGVTEIMVVTGGTACRRVPPASLQRS